MARLTIKQIAKIAGVSPSAVSIVLNDKKGVSENTRIKVKEIVERMHYTPNPNSRRLLFNKTNNIAILFKRNISPMEHLFHSELNRVILHECESLGYNLVFTSATIENESVILPNVIKSRDVDGIIFYGDIDPLIISSINKYDIPFIIVDNHSVMPNTLSVRADYFAASYTAANYLINLGHTKIAYIGSNVLPLFSTQTFSGFKKAIEEHKLLLPINWMQFDASDEDTSYQCMRNILMYDQIPTAIFCSADIFAIGAIRMIKEYGLKIPEDIQITGIDDIILSKYIEPSLTTVRIDKVQMGKLAIDLLIKSINKEERNCCIVSSNDLIIRNSTCKI